MAIQTVNLGTAANDGTGDTLRSGGDKINDNFAELDTRLSAAEIQTSQITALSNRVQVAEADVSNVETSLLTVTSDVNALDQRLFAEENKAVHEVPAGGIVGQVLTKTSSLDYAADWRTPAAATGGSGNVLTNVLTNRKFGLYKAYAPAGDFTNQTIMELETEFYAVRIGIPNITAGEIAGVKVMVAVGNDFTGAQWQTYPDLPGGTWTAPRTVTLQPRIASNVASITYTDLIVLKSIPRVDGGTRPIIGIRIEFPAGTTVTVPSQDFYGWRALQEFSPFTRPMRVSSQAVLGVTTPASYTTTASVDTNCCVPTIEYYTVKPGKQMMFVGDSTVEGSGGNTRAWGAFQRAAASISTPENPIEYYNCGLHGIGSATYQLTIEAHAPDVLPTHLFYYPLTVNDIPVIGGINDSTYTQVYQGIANALAKAKAQKIIPRIALFGCLPYNAAFKDSGANDSKRRDLNTWFTTFGGVEFIDGYAEAIAGPEVNGQTTIASGLTNDNVHPNDAGYETLMGVVAPFMQSFV